MFKFTIILLTILAKQFNVKLVKIIIPLLAFIVIFSRNNAKEKNKSLKEKLKCYLIRRKKNIAKNSNCIMKILRLNNCLHLTECNTLNKQKKKPKKVNIF